MLTPASRATSSRRSPGTRRRPGVGVDARPLRRDQRPTRRQELSCLCSVVHDVHGRVPRRVQAGPAVTRLSSTWLTLTMRCLMGSQTKPTATAGETDMNTIAIVGAGPGLGTAVARRFGREGFSVALLA